LVETAVLNRYCASSELCCGREPNFRILRIRRRRILDNTLRRTKTKIDSMASIKDLIAEVP
jgi:hypothetical protein